MSSLSDGTSDHDNGVWYCDMCGEGIDLDHYSDIDAHAWMHRDGWQFDTDNYLHRWFRPLGATSHEHPVADGTSALRCSDLECPRYRAEVQADARRIEDLLEKRQGYIAAFADTASEGILIQPTGWSVPPECRYDFGGGMLRPIDLSIIFPPQPRGGLAFDPVVNELENESSILTLIRQLVRRQDEAVEAACLQMLYGNGGANKAVVVRRNPWKGTQSVELVEADDVFEAQIIHYIEEQDDEW